MLGFPQAHSSATVIAPARDTTRSAARYGSVIGSKQPRPTTRSGTACAGAAAAWPQDRRPPLRAPEPPHVAPHAGREPQPARVAPPGAPIDRLDRHEAMAERLTR